MDTSSHPNQSTASRCASLTPDKARRRVLVLGLGGTLGISALAAVPAVATNVRTIPTEDQPASSGYRETDHVRSYYATTRL